jgi:1-aminocyclopropane-1-carboxylate deaminase
VRRYDPEVRRPAVPTPLHEIHDDILERSHIRILIKRDDLIHPAIPGNKWRKLIYNLQAARDAGHDTLLTFGGAYSNHIYAVASAGRIFGFQTIGVIRGEEHLPLNPVLGHAVTCGMTLRYLDRASYRRKYDQDIIASLAAQFGDFYLVPEGGTNCLAVRGCAEAVAEIEEPFDYLCCPMGTGGTLTGLVAGLAGRARALGFSALKGGSFLADDVRELLTRCEYPPYDNWAVVTDYHFGGFARQTEELTRFIDDFRERHQIALDFVYTGKMMFGILDLVAGGHFPTGSTIVAVHTGGVDIGQGSPLDSVADG